MKKHTGHIWKKICILGACMWFLFAGNRAVYAASGEIQIQLKDLQTKDSSREEIPVQMYRMGTVDEDGRPVFDPAWGISECPQDSAQLDETAKKLAEQVTGEPAMEGRTDAEGRVCFQNVENGVYLAVIPKKNAYGTVAPFLIWLPCYEEVNGNIEGPLYRVEAEPKASPHEKTKPGGHKPGGNDPQTPSVPQAPPTQTTSVKTGDTSMVEIYLILAAIAALSIGFIIIDRRKRR